MGMLQQYCTKSGNRRLLSSPNCRLTTARALAVTTFAAFLIPTATVGQETVADIVSGTPPSQLAVRLGLPGVAGAGCGRDCNTSGPLRIAGLHDVTIQRIRIDGSASHCIEITDGASNIVIRKTELVNCAGSGININDARNIKIENVKITNTKSSGINLFDSTEIVIRANYLEDVSSGLYALDSRGITFERNFVRNVRGPMPRGQMVQFDKVSGPGNRIRCNVVVNEPGKSSPEDAVNMFKTFGTAESPVLITSNKILGGGPSKSGGGILIGDYGGAHIHVAGNILVDPGQYGLGIAGGTHAKLINNTVYGRRQDFTNVGLYVWNVEPESSACHSNEVRKNRISYKNAAGQKNPHWNAGNCGLIRGYAHNTWYARLDPHVIYRELPACRPE